MPFGDHVTTWRATVSREEYRPGIQKIPSKPVKVPEADAPWWWTEYLTDEWKRRNHYKQQPRDRRTQWQRGRDDWDERLTPMGPTGLRYVWKQTESDQATT